MIRRRPILQKHGLAVSVLLAFAAALSFFQGGARAAEPVSAERAARRQATAGKTAGGKAAAGDPHDHGKGEVHDDRQYTPEEKARIERLFYHVLCKCLREDWSKTLAGCPDGCADEQKNQIRAAVKAGRSDKEILAEQVRLAGTEQVLSVPDTRLTYVVPFVVLTILTAGMLWLLIRSVRRPPPPKEAVAAPVAAPTSEQPRQADEDDDRLARAVERDLEEMDG